MKKFHIIQAMVPVFLCCASAWAQEANYLSPRDYSVIPPSPEVSSLMRFVEFPVSPFTGQPDITLPIYTLSEGSLEVPVALRYHGGGIRVNEQPGIVGMGWSLESGGCVSLSVHGLPDYLKKGGQYGLRGLSHINDTEFANNDRRLRDSIINRTLNIVDYNPFDLPSRVLPHSICADYNDGKSDMANDVYRFSFLGRSGTWIINPEDGELCLSTSSGLRVMSHTTTLTGGSYVLLDEYHNKYEFSEEEQTFFHYKYRTAGEWVNDSILYGSAWHLKTITSVNGDTIRFTYRQAGRKTTFLGCRDYHRIIVKSGYAPEIEEIPITYAYETSTHFVDYFPRYVETIQSRSTIVKFCYDTGVNTLEAIEVYRRTSPPELVRRYSLDHVPQTFGYAGGNPISRKMLDKVHERGQSGDSLCLYRMTYESHVAPTGDFYRAQDHWGYHNGANNTTLAMMHSTCRDPYGEYAKNGILSDITYLTGGHVHFDWELNDYGHIGPTNAASVGKTTYTHRLFEIAGNSTGNTITSSTMAFDGLTPRYFSINEPTNATLYMSNYITPLLPEPFLLCVTGDYQHHHGLYFDEFGNPQLGNTTYPHVEIHCSNGYQKDYYIDAPTCSSDSILVPLYYAGDYTLRLRYPYYFTDVAPSTVNAYFGSTASVNDLTGYGRIRLKVTTRESTAMVNPKWGGLRIRDITYVPSVNGEAMSRHYVYRDSIEGTLSSGTILERPENCYLMTTYSDGMESVAGTLIAQVETQVTTGHTDAVFSTPCGQSHVEYPVVWETSGDNSQFVTKYTYSSQRPFTINSISKSSFYGFGYGGARMNTSLDYRTGDLLSKDLYEGSRKKSGVYYDYELLEKSNNPWFSSDFIKFIDYEGMAVQYPQTSNDIYSSNYFTYLYKLIPYNKRPHSVERVEYGDDNHEGDFSEQTWYSYFYSGYDGHEYSNLPKSSTVLNSDGSETETYYTYLRHDDAPIALRETEVSVNGGAIVGARRFEYDNHNRVIATYLAPTGLAVTGDMELTALSHGHYAPASLLAAISIKEYGFRYDEEGHVVEVSFNGVPLASYLWGYRGTYPVAEIKGISHQSLCSSLPSGLQPAALLHRHDITGGELLALHGLFPHNEVTTYTYDWLVGMGTKTDSRGITTTFGHDSHGRLSTIKDINDNIINRYVYHYGN